MVLSSVRHVGGVILGGQIQNSQAESQDQKDGKKDFGAEDAIGYSLLPAGFLAENRHFVFHFWGAVSERAESGAIFFIESERRGW